MGVVAVVGVYVEEEGCQYTTLWQAILLGLPFTPLVIQLDIEASFDYFAQIEFTFHAQ